MYLLNRDAYVCDECSAEMKWDETDTTHGTMWECEKCGRNFCSKCFVDRCGEQAFTCMLKKSDIVLCHDCFTKENNGGAENV